MRNYLFQKMHNSGSNSKFVVLIAFGIATLCLMALPLQVQAASKAKAAKATKSTKERLVLMPLRIPEEDKNLSGAMETALVEGLQKQYDVYSGEQVAQKANEIFNKENRKKGHTECDETKCMQDIADSFGAELLATANVSKQDGSYFLALSIQNLFDNKVVYSKALPCKKCDATQVIEKLKILSSGVDADTEAVASDTVVDSKEKIEKLKQEQAAREAKMKEASASELLRLKEAQARDDEKLAKLKKAVAANQTLSPQNLIAYPTLQSAQAEIIRLTAKIAEIEAGYEKELKPTRDQITQRYQARLDALDKEQSDEFDTPDGFKQKQIKRRAELEKQQEAEIAKFNAAAVAAEETAPLKKTIKELSAHDYILGQESVTVELGKYDSTLQEFPFKVEPKYSYFGGQSLKTAVSMPIEDAKVFKQQWQAGLIHPEIKVRAGEKFDIKNIQLINDVDGSRLKPVDGKLMSLAQAQAWEEKEVVEKGFAMIRIPGKNYEMGKYDVTQKGWRDIMGNSPSHFSSCGDTCPVEEVSWNDVHEFIQKLNAKTGKQYRLPTEKEWEYACYGGSRTEYCGGSNLDSVAWYDKNSNSTTHPVGQKQANGYGLYDMSGNVDQWMQNEYNGGRALRGGPWLGSSGDLRAAYRDLIDPTNRNSIIGFRLARTLP
jgi:hypothetical protein